MLNEEQRYHLISILYSLKKDIAYDVELGTPGAEELDTKLYEAIDAAKRVDI